MITLIKPTLRLGPAALRREHESFRMVGLESRTLSMFSLFRLIAFRFGPYILYVSLLIPSEFISDFFFLPWRILSFLACLMMLVPSRLPSPLLPAYRRRRMMGVPLMNIGTSLNAKVFSVVKIDCADSRVCFGKIGAGTSAFCVKTGCVTKFHGESKMPFRRTPAVYMCISQVAGSTAFIQPTLRESQIPAGLWDVWSTLQLPLKGWRMEFQAVESNDNANATMEDIKKETTFLDTADTFRTPAKRKRGGDEEDHPRLLGELKSVRYVRFLPTEEEEMAKVKEFGLGRGVLTDVVSRIETSMISMNEGLEEVVILTTNHFRVNKDDLKMISGIVHYTVPCNH